MAGVELLVRQWHFQLRRRLFLSPRAAAQHSGWAWWEGKFGPRRLPSCGSLSHSSHPPVLPKVFFRTGCLLRIPHVWWCGVRVRSQVLYFWKLSNTRYSHM